MQRILALAFAMVASFALAEISYAQCNPAPTAPPSTKPAVVQPAQPSTPATVQSQAGHEYAPLLEQTINYKDWTYKSLNDGTPVNLREWSRGKKLVLVVYFAPWCGNWKAEAPGVARLLGQYKQHGFDVIAVSEYAPVTETQSYFSQVGGPPYTVVVESDTREARDKTSHYGYRQLSGDSRKWGSPFNIFLEPARLAATGEILTEKAWVVGGELIEKDVERFIRERLGLAENAVAPCENKPANKP